MNLRNKLNQIYLKTIWQRDGMVKATLDEAQIFSGKKKQTYQVYFVLISGGFVNYQLMNFIEFFYYQMGVGTFLKVETLILASILVMTYKFKGFMVTLFIKRLVFSLVTMTSLYYWSIHLIEIDFLYRMLFDSIISVPLTLAFIGIGLWLFQNLTDSKLMVSWLFFQYVSVFIYSGIMGSMTFDYNYFVLVVTWMVSFGITLAIMVILNRVETTIGLKKEGGGHVH